MERTAEPRLIGDIFAASTFWRPNTMAEEAEKLKRLPGTYIDARGLVRCSRCGQPRMFLLPEAGRWLPCACSCSGRETEEEFAERVAQLRAESGIAGRYARADFDAFEETDDNRAAFESCLRYAMHFDGIRKKGMGIYLSGPSGVGKTYLACCVGNMLLDAGVQVLFANVNTILSEIRYSYAQRASELPIVRRYIEAEFVIFDDLGTEKYGGRQSEPLSFAQDKLFQIIDGRYANVRPTMFTSNYTLEQLVSERGIQVKTVDRIASLSTRKYALRGKSHRLERID